MKVKITFKEGNINLPKGLSFTNATQEWAPGENFDISKFPKISGKAAADNIQVKSWFLDQDGKQVTNKTVVPDKDSTYTLHIGIYTLSDISVSNESSTRPNGNQNNQQPNNSKNDESNGSRSTNGSNSSNGSDNRSPKTGVNGMYKIVVQILSWF